MEGQAENWSNMGNSLFMIRAPGAEPEYYPWGVGEMRWSDSANYFSKSTMVVYCFANDSDFREWLQAFPDECALEIVEHQAGSRRDDYQSGTVRARMTDCGLGDHSIGNVVPMHAEDVESLMLNVEIRGCLEVFG